MRRPTLQLSLIAVSIGMALAASAQAQSKLNGQSDAIARLSANTSGAAQVSFSNATGAARFVRAAPGANLIVQSRVRASTDAAKQNDSHRFLTEYASLFGISNPGAELMSSRVARDRQGRTHITFKQVYQGVPVFGAELKTHFDAADKLVAVNGTYIPGIDLNITPSRSADDARSVALESVKAELGRVAILATSQPTLMIYREGLARGIEGANRLVWHVEVGNRIDVRDFVFVDAHTGKVVDKIAGIHTAKNRRAFDSQGATAPGPNYPNSPFWIEGQGFPTGTTEADNMIAASGEIYDLFKNAFGRDSYDGNGATMDSIFNRGNACPNASWGGAFISFCPGTTTDDITAHEWGHAYTEYTHNLIYAWQPGALNESYSDIWGETVDRINGRGGDTPDAARTTGVCAAITAPAQSVTVLTPASIAGVKNAGTAAWGPQTFTLAGATLQGVEIGSTSAACAALPANSLTGKVAFIDRGTCGFSVKALNAQNAGAVGVIIGNNQAGTAVINMSITTGFVPTIPSLSVSQNDGTAIKGVISTPVTLTMSRNGVPTYNTVRWLMGEDSTAFGGAIRDMYNPTCAGNPGKVSDTQYVCSTGDSGGVHSNSGVPNHAYALLVDGGTYNGQTVGAIGLTKAAHIYFRAQTVYQGPASDFVDHADAIEQSCTDLTGVNLADLKFGTPSGEIINASDCAQVAKAALAVELRTPPAQCNFQPLLAKNPPPLCASGSPTLLMSDTFEGGKKGGVKWKVSFAGSTGDFTPRNFGVVNTPPAPVTGYAMFGSNPNIGTCAPGGDETGLQRLESPEVTIPAGATILRMAFDHYVATEASFDGGNVKVSVNGGAWQLVSAANFVYNPYNAALATAGQGNTNPMQGEAAFTGSDGGSVEGSWGRSIINLAPYAVPGDKIKLRFELGNDGCGGVKGWYLDDVKVYRCTP